MRRKLCAIRTAEKLRTKCETIPFHCEVQLVVCVSRVRVTFVFVSRCLSRYFQRVRALTHTHQLTHAFDSFILFLLLLVAFAEQSCFCVRSSSLPAKLLGYIHVYSVNWSKVEKVFRIDKVVCLLCFCWVVREKERKKGKNCSKILFFYLLFSSWKKKILHFVHKIYLIPICATSQTHTAPELNDENRKFIFFCILHLTFKNSIEYWNILII